MPRYSTQLDALPQYPFARVSRLSKEVEQRDGIKVINAGIGIPDAEAPPTLKRYMSEYILQDKSTYGYPIDVYDERGIPELIDAIRQHYRERHGVELKPENIAVTNWTKEVLHNLPRMFGNGYGVVPEPVYPAYEGGVILSNHEIRRVPTSKDSGWLPKLTFSDSDAFFYFCDPNNPTGSVADLEYYERLLDEVKEHDIVGIFDKAYKDYVFDKDTNPISITQIPELMNYGYEVVSFSKHHNFVGIGLGWIVSSEENIDRWLKFAGQFWQGVSWYKQKAGVEALTNPKVKKEMEQYMQELKERRDIFVRGLNELGLECEPPRATPYLWVKVPESYDDEEFVLKKLLNEAHVAFMPGSYFGESGRGYFRATIFLPKSEIQEALNRMKTVLK